MKTCSCCNRELPLEAFGKHRLRKDGLQNACRECKARRDREYYEQNRARKARYDRERGQNETRKARDRRNERRRALYAASPWARRRHNKQWKQSNPEKVRLQTQRRRARIKKARGEFSAENWESIRDMFSNLCAYCGQPKPLTIDHVIPLSRGGQHDKHNIVPACINCNSQKHTSIDGWPIVTSRRSVVEFYGEAMDITRHIAFADSVS